LPLLVTIKVEEGNNSSLLLQVDIDINLSTYSASLSAVFGTVSLYRYCTVDSQTLVAFYIQVVSVTTEPIEILRLITSIFVNN